MKNTSEPVKRILEKLIEIHNDDTPRVVSIYYFGFVDSITLEVKNSREDFNTKIFEVKIYLSPSSIATPEKTLNQIYEDLCSLPEKVNVPFQNYIDMAYEDFKEATCMPTPDECGTYDYAISQDNDTKETRLDYIKYLTDEKGYEL